MKKALKKSVRKALRKHTIALGVTTGVATAIVLSSTGATQKISETLGRGIGKLLRFRPSGVWEGLREVAAGTWNRNGHRMGQEESTAHEPRGVA